MRYLTLKRKHFEEIIEYINGKYFLSYELINIVKISGGYCVIAKERIR